MSKCEQRVYTSYKNKINKCTRIWFDFVTINITSTLPGKTIKISPPKWHQTTFPIKSFKTTRTFRVPSFCLACPRVMCLARIIFFFFYFYYYLILLLFPHHLILPCTSPHPYESRNEQTKKKDDALTFCVRVFFFLLSSSSFTAASSFCVHDDDVNRRRGRFNQNLANGNPSVFFFASSSWLTFSWWLASCYCFCSCQSHTHTRTHTQDDTGSSCLSILVCFLGVFIRFWEKCQK